MEGERRGKERGVRQERGEEGGRDRKGRGERVRKEVNKGGSEGNRGFSI